MSGDGIKVKAADNGAPEQARAAAFARRTLRRRRRRPVPLNAPLTPRSPAQDVGRMTLFKKRTIMTESDIGPHLKGALHKALRCRHPARAPHRLRFALRCTLARSLRLE